MPANPKVIDRFNVDGEDYVIEPEIDPVPVQNSQRAVMSGGVWQAIKDVEASANFLNNPSIAGAVFGHLIGTAWRRNSDLYVGNSFYCPVDSGDIIAVYCKISGNGYFRWSLDGKQWTDGTVNGTTPTGDLFMMLYGGGLFVAAIMNGSGSSATLDIYSSSDGKEWSFKSTISSFFIFAVSDTIAYFSGEWWMVVPEGLKHSVDLVTWDIASELTWPSSMTYMEQRAGVGVIDDKLVVCTSTDLWYTTDKTTWTKFFTPLSTALGVGSLVCRDGICACLACILSANEPNLITFSRDLSAYEGSSAQEVSSSASTAQGIGIAGGYIFWPHSNQKIYVSAYQNYANVLVADVDKVGALAGWSNIRYANGLWFGSENYSRDLVRWNVITCDTNGDAGRSVERHIGRAIYVERLGRWVSPLGYSDIDVLRSAGVLSYQV